MYIIVYSKLILYIEQEKRDHHEHDEEYKKKNEKYAHIDMSL